MDSRGTATARPAPGAFRCLVCQVVVTGTAAGHCPRCGFVPPSALVTAGDSKGTRAGLRVLVLLLIAVVLLLILVQLR
ncbi:MAG: hypothetical protein IPQ07_09780 [Myxococcales bacterium]|nr:hypothetical protein [Myxococcales bacterium]